MLSQGDAGQPVDTEWRFSKGVWNAYIQYEDAGLEGLDAGLGIADILNDEPPVLHPYDGGHQPIPSRGREVYLKLSLEL